MDSFKDFIFLNEIFKKTAPYEMVNTPLSGFHAAIAPLSDGTILLMTLYEEEITKAKLPKIWKFKTAEFSFARGEMSYDEASEIAKRLTPEIIDKFYSDKRFKNNITGGGNALEVFGTVLKFIKDINKKLSLDILTFDADKTEPSRVKLYKTMAKKLGSGKLLGVEDKEMGPDQYAKFSIDLSGKLTKLREEGKLT